MNTLIEKIMLNDYETYSGKTLELYFKKKMQESFDYRAIGSWWESKGNQNEIDIIGICLDNKQTIVAEVKRQRKNFKPQLLADKIEVIKTKIPSKYQIESACWTIEDM